MAWSGVFGSMLLGGVWYRWWGALPIPNDQEPTLKELHGEPFEYFSPYEAAVLHEVAGLIVPADHTPGAKEAKVIQEFDRMAGEQARFKDLSQRGVRWLDDQAQERFDAARFLELSPSKQVQILTMAETGHISFLEKVYEKLRYGETRVGFKFFDMMKRQTFAVFYSHPMGWTSVGYHGPPQWSGHMDYHICV